MLDLVLGLASITAVFYRPLITSLVTPRRVLPLRPQRTLVNLGFDTHTNVVGPELSMSLVMVYWMSGG